MQKIAMIEPDGRSFAESPSTSLTELMRLHIEDYQEKLDHCTAAMLQYEWAWLEEHIADLELCQSQPEMQQILGGKTHVEQLLLESHACQAALKSIMLTQGVEPARQPQAVVGGEHAWEIRQDSMKRMWGLD